MASSITKDGTRFVEKPPKTAMGYKDYGTGIPDRLAGTPSDSPIFDHYGFNGWPDMSDEETWDE